MNLNLKNKNEYEVIELYENKSLDELVAKLDELGLSLPTSSDLDSGDMADA